jgi:hypothetical protein
VAVELVVLLAFELLAHGEPQAPTDKTTATSSATTRGIRHVLAALISSSPPYVLSQLPVVQVHPRCQPEDWAARHTLEDRDFRVLSAGISDVSLTTCERRGAAVAPEEARGTPVDIS